MDSQANENNEFCVDEGAFWHTNMDLYYGYTVGEVVEVEHEPNKYWLASIEYCFKNLILLKWIGNYAEFWVDTSIVSTMVANTPSAFDEPLNQPKRLFPLGYHLQMQLKSQFKLEKPTRALEIPSLYNPSKDPYADIRTVDDLLAHEVDQINDTFNINQSSANNMEPASLVLAKCNTKINYKQEDVDEVEAALQNLNEIDNADFDKQEDGENAQIGIVETNINKPQLIGIVETHNSSGEPVLCKLSVTMPKGESGSEEASQESSDSAQGDKNWLLAANGPILKQNNLQQTTTSQPTNNVNKSNTSDDPENCDEVNIQLCKRLQESVISRGYYNGVDSSGKQQTERVFHSKPKQFFDVGGANHERVFVPGTLLEVCHTTVSPTLGLELCHWFAYVVKNIGGRLTMRWLLSDEPRFRQGRLELKYRHSRWIKEEDEGDESNLSTELTSKKSPIDSSEVNGKQQQDILPAKAISFSFHFCDPRISTIEGEPNEKNTSKTYRLPDHVASFIEQTTGKTELVESIRSDLMARVFCPRRLHLDKDRPLIDNIISTVRSRRPTYLDIQFSSKEHQQMSREVLISCPEMTKLLKGYIQDELEPGVYEVHSEPLGETEEIIKFIYPFDSSYAILPLDWANNNQDCLSIDPSRNPTPTLLENPTSQDNETGNNNNNNGNELQQKAENNTPAVSLFHCRVDNNMRELVESKFNVMDQLEVVHPSSDTTICLGRIRKLVYPLIWIQISPDCYTLLPFTSTNIYPSRWCETYNHPVVSLLPPRKKCSNHLQKQNYDNNGASRKRKRVRLAVDDDNDFDRNKSPSDDGKQLYEKEDFDLNALNFRQTDLNYMLNEKSNYIKIFFNHKCFTGPSLSKSKICSLPQYVGPGPLRLVMEEVVTKVISVAYVPPRILNDLSSGGFQRLLIEKNMALKPMEFKAKYQKRIHKEDILVCVNPDDVALYCETLCEHIKCCYNLFGPNSYDGDDCPGHCRALTKSNKFMKRATYYRDKARAGEFLGSGNNNNNSSQSKGNQSDTKNTSNKSGGSNNNNNNNSSSNDDEDKVINTDINPTDSNLQANQVSVSDVVLDPCENGHQFSPLLAEPQIIIDNNEVDIQMVGEGDENSNDNCENQGTNNIILRRSTNSSEWSIEPEFDLFESQADSRPENWSIDDVAQRLDWCRLSRFKSILKSEVGNHHNDNVDLPCHFISVI